MTTLDGTRRAVSYRRVSTRDQAGEKHVSLPVQRQRYLDACRANRWIPTAEYVDVDSGRNDRRPQYQAMLASVRAGEVDVVVVQFLDRLGRNPREILRRIWEIQDLGVLVHVTDEDVKEELILLIRAAMAGKESERISQRVIPTLERVVAEGRWPGPAPFGYRLIRDPLSPERGRLVIDEDQAAVVRRLFALYAEGNHGWARCADLLNREGVRSPRQGLWWSSAIQYVLSNEAYVGRLIWRGHELVCPPIISVALFAQVGALIERRKLSAVRLPPGERFLLAGLVRCTCGTFRHGWTVNRSGRTHPGKPTYVHPPRRYYRCAHQAQQRSCNVGLIDAETLEDWVRAYFRTWRLPEAVAPLAQEFSTDGATAQEAARTRDAIRGRIARYRSRLSSAFDALMDKAITREEFAAKRAEYVEAIQSEERALGAVSADVPLPSDQALARVESLRHLIDHASPEELHQGLSTIIQHVQIDSRHTWHLVPRAELAVYFSYPGD